MDSDHEDGVAARAVLVHLCFAGAALFCAFVQDVVDFILVLHVNLLEALDHHAAFVADVFE